MISRVYFIYNQSYFQNTVNWTRLYAEGQRCQPVLHCVIWNIIAAGHQPAADHIPERFEIFGSMVQWFDRSMVPWFHGSISKCLAAAPVFLFRATRHFVLFSCEFKICAEVVVHRMFAVFLNSLNGKNSSRTIVRDIFSVFFMLGFKISYSEYFLSHRLFSRE